jgi:hypothetical protein
MKKGLEPTRPVHEPWEEVDLDNNVEWEPPSTDRYTGALGGGVCGPTNDAQAAGIIGLAALFFFIYPLTLFKWIADCTKQYAYTDWVVPAPRKDRDGNTTSRPILSPVFVSEGQSPPRNARHRADKSPVKPDITPNYIIAWIAICILAGAFAGGKNNRGIKNMYRSAPYGYSIPYIQNAMPEEYFIFLRRFLHFADNSKRKKRGEDGHDVLFKVRHVLDEIMKGIQKSWNAGERVTIDESMI